MKEYVQSIGDAFKKARSEQGLTLEAVAEKSGVDIRTVINIEQYRGNPKLENLYPLVRTLKLDVREIFYPEMKQASPSIQQLRVYFGRKDQSSRSIRPPFTEKMITFHGGIDHLSRRGDHPQSFPL